MIKATMSKAEKAAQKVREAKPTKPTVKDRLLSLQVAISNYFRALLYQRPDGFQITLHAKTQDGKDGVFNVSSLLSSVLTAQGLGKQVRLEAETDSKGGTLYIRFYSPVPKTGLEGM